MGITILLLTVLLFDVRKTQLDRENEQFYANE